MFRLQDNVPSNYIEGSRDFQLFCRLYDCVNTGVKNDIDSIPEILDPLKIKDNLLSLYGTKVGFFSTGNYNDHVLRSILSAFPYIIRYKGTKYGIKLAISTILKTEGIYDTPEIKFDNVNHSIQIYISTAIYNKEALVELLEYILPVGYTYTLEKYTAQQIPTKLNGVNKLKTLLVPEINTSQIRGTDRILDSLDTQSNTYNFSSDIQNNYISTIGSLTVVGSEAINLDTQTYSKDRNNTNRDKIDQESNIVENEYSDGE